MAMAQGEEEEEDEEEEDRSEEFMDDCYSLSLSIRI